MTFLELAQLEKASTQAIESESNISITEVIAVPMKPSHGILAHLRYYEEFLDHKMGIEAYGPERITPDEKKPPPTWIMGIIWSSGTYSLSSITLGMVGWEYGLSLTESIFLILFGSLLGASVAGWCATLGPSTGLRQVAISRYSFGWYPSKLIALLNLISQIGWASGACITGGQALSAVSNYQISLIFGVVIIAVVSLIASFGGYKSILWVEKFWWMPFFIVFLDMFGEVDSHWNKGYISLATSSCGTRKGEALSLFAIFYGSGASWAFVVSDYYVHYPADMSKVKIFCYTTFGIWIPIFVSSLLGALIAAEANIRPEWAEAYYEKGVGSLLLLVLYPLPFVKFLLTLMSIAGIGLNIIAIYSGALAVQQLAKPLQAIPRFIWSIIMFAAMLALSIGGRDHIVDFLSNMLSLLGYYNTCFFVILFIEHQFFRSGNLANYDLKGWNTPASLPIGLAGLAAFLFGWAGAIFGMVETFYVGVLGTKIGAFVGDVGNELAFAFTLLSYLH